MGEGVRRRGGVDAEGGRMMAIGKSLWTGNEKLRINTASSKISISVYSAENNKVWTLGVANCTGGSGLEDDSGGGGGGGALTDMSSSCDLMFT